MAVRDLEAFIRQRAALFDPNLDTNPGSPFDVQVIQRVVQRVGPDPFSVDMQTFIDARLKQAYPDIAIGEGDAITDIAIKPAVLLWDPIVREITRIKQGQSFSNAESLTEEEADALGANLFAERAQGSLARGTARLFFAQPQNLSISPVNFVTSKDGLHFYPTESQSIRVEEMLLNTADDGTFYFDITVIAETPGSEYNLGPNELVSIANVDPAVRVTNLRKFSDGDDAASAAEFVDKTRQELTERSLVTLRGIAAKVTRAFPEITRLNVVGFNDPEMQRDIIKGGGLGPAIASGIDGATVSDGVGAPLTRRFFTNEVNFISLVGPANTVPAGFVLTVFRAFGSVDASRDMRIVRVINANTVDVEKQEMAFGQSNLCWSLRKSSLTLSDIPGGILFPDSPAGTVTINDGEIHIGGATDVYVRGQGFDEATLTVDNLTDDSPEIAGQEFNFDSGDSDEGVIDDLVLGADYIEGDETWNLLVRAGRDALTLQIVDGVNAGLYRILSVDLSGASPVVTVTPPFTSPVAANARYRIFDDIDIALYDIKETRVSGSDLITTQNFDVVTTASAVDFDVLGVAEDDVLRILNGPDKGDYRIVEAPLAPGFTSIRVDKSFTSSQAGLQYQVFRPNAAGDLLLPLVRIRSIELLDSSQQPVGTIIPYARPVDVQSRAFQNPSRGVKHDVSDAVLGLVSQPEPPGGFAVGGLTLNLQTSLGSVAVVFGAGPNLSLATVISQINAAALAQISEDSAAIPVGPDRFGIRPIGNGLVSTNGNNDAVTALFGTDEQRTTQDIRSASIDADGGWDEVEPFIDLTTGLDVIQLLDGNQVGFVHGPYEMATGPVAPATATSTALYATNANSSVNFIFYPEAGVRLQVGARSIGSVRVFFLDPTSFEVRANETFFSLQTESGLIRFTPDPTLSAQRIPALPSGSKPTDGETANGSGVLTSASQDLLLSSIQAGDQLVIDYHPIAGSQVLSDPVAGLANQTLVFSIDGSPDKTLVFIRDDISIAPTEVTRAGVAEQINAAAGIDIAKITSSNTLEFEADAAIVIRAVGTANPTILGVMAGTASSFNTNDQRNTAPHAGSYIVQSVDSPTQLTIEGLFPTHLAPFTSPFTRQQFKIYRTGIQRISTSEMQDNSAEAGLYYFDVELVSEGTGDLWNIQASQQLTVEGYRSDGYYLTTEDSNLTFSVLERPRLSISKTILEPGVDDDPSNATQIAGQNILINYDRSSLVEDGQNFISSETERVVNSSPLSRHLIPHFVRFDMTYVGGAKEEVVVPEIEKYTNRLSPAEAFESSDIQKIVSDRGATSIRNPIDLIAIVHDVDRSVTAARSQDQLSTGRLAAFVPDRLNVVRNIT